MHRIIFRFILLFFPFTPLISQVEYFAAGINVEQLQKHLTVLTSDSLAGRETGTEGNLKATEYIARYFAEIGIPPIVNNSYFQPIVFSAENFAINKINIKQREYAPMWDFYTFPSYNTDIKLEEEEVLFLGYGIDDTRYSDYKKINTEGKVILIYNGEPLKKDSISLLTKKKEPSEWSTDIAKKIICAKKHGVKAMLIIDGDLQKNMNKNRSSYLNTSMKVGKNDLIRDSFVNASYISTTMARVLIDNNFEDIIKARDYIIRKGKSKHLVLKTQLEINQKKNIRYLEGRNVLGYIEGTDPKLKKELVIITAHLDHLGKRADDIYRGADDDGSGTCAVMEIAKAFAEAKQKGQGPRRSVLCMLVTGEEKGLLGSNYYTTYPIFPLKNTVADVNIDMIGRVDAEHTQNPDYIYVIGADKISSELHQINEMMNQNYTGLKLDYRYNDEADPNRYYYRSDHYNFAKNNIPVVFYFNGTHEDYHRPSDSIEKINFPLLAKRAKLAFYTAWEIANREKRLKIDKN